MLYNIHYDICALLITGFALVFTLVKKGMRLQQNRIMLGVLIVAFFAAVSDIASSVAISYPERFSVTVCDLMNYAFLAMQNGLCFLFTIYTLSVCGILYDNSRKMKFLVLSVIPYGIDIILLLLNPFFRWVFYYDADGIYTHGSAFLLIYFNAFLYMIGAAFNIFKNGKNVERGKKIMCISFILAIFLTAVFQMFFPYILISLCVGSLSLLGILLVMDNEDEIIDAVSRCFNRRYFIQTNTQRMGNNTMYSILTVRIRQLNLHTATLGIVMTNRMIGQVGDFLRSLNKDVEVYCYDNGAFALLYNGNDMGEELMEQINRRFEEPWMVNDTNIHLETGQQKINIGEQVESVEELLLVLDGGMAKTETAEQKPEENITILDYRRELSVEQAVKRALATDGFRVTYQPVWDVKSNTITRAEVLLQLEDEELGVISPGEFMPIAEKKGISIEIGRILFRKVCKMYRDRKLDELGIDVIEIKMTRLQCMHANLTDIALEISGEYGVDSSHLGFQVSTETILDNQEEVVLNLNELHRAGFRISIDDFGYQAMNLLKLFTYPIDSVRIDKHFLWQAMDASNATILFKNTIRMLREMQLLTIAEGVEDVYQKELAVEMNCDMMQGFFFSKSVGEEGFYRYCKGFNLK